MELSIPPAINYPTCFASSHVTRVCWCLSPVQIRKMQRIHPPQVHHRPILCYYRLLDYECGRGRGLGGPRLWRSAGCGWGEEPTRRALVQRTFGESVLGEESRNPESPIKVLETWATASVSGVRMLDTQEVAGGQIKYMSLSVSMYIICTTTCYIITNIAANLLYQPYIHFFPTLWTNTQYYNAMS